MLKKLGWIAVMMLFLTGCGENDSLWVWQLDENRWTAQSMGDSYRLEADIPSVNERVNAANQAKAENLARIFVMEMERTDSNRTEKDGSGLWVLRGESSGIDHFAISTALIEYTHLPCNAHGSYRIETTTYRSSDGEMLELRDLFSQEADVYRELSRLSRWMVIHTGQLGDYADEKWIESGTEPISDNFSAFLVHPEGLEILFPPCAIGPWALGEQRITIPWLYLEPFLTPETAAAVGVS